MWDGKLSLPIQKHRDFLHSGFTAHEFANGATYHTDPTPISVDRNPIDFDIFDPPRDYYFIDLSLHAGGMYTFLVPAESDKSEPTDKTLAKTIDETVANPVEGGRDWFNYIDLEDEQTFMHPRVIARLEEEPFLTQSRPRPKKKSYDTDEPEAKQFSLESILRDI